MHFFFMCLIKSAGGVAAKIAELQSVVHRQPGHAAIQAGQVHIQVVHQPVVVAVGRLVLGVVHGVDEPNVHLAGEKALAHVFIGDAGKYEPLHETAHRAGDVGRILRTFKIKKNVEVTDNGKIII